MSSIRFLGGNLLVNLGNFISIISMCQKIMFLSNNTLERVRESEGMCVCYNSGVSRKHLKL